MKPAGWRRALGVVLILALAAWLGRPIVRESRALADYPWSAHPWRLAASTAALVLVLFWGVGVLRRVLGHLEVGPVATVKLARVWFLSNLARYLPGKVFQFVFVAEMSGSAGVAPAVLLTAVLLHAGLSLLAAALLAAWTLVPASGGAAAWLIVPLSGLALLPLHPGVLNPLLGLLPRLLKRPLVRWTGSWGDGVVLLALSLGGWMLYGGAYHLFVSALSEAPWSLLPRLAGVNALSFVVGYASLLPGGLGVREVAMAELLRPLVPAGVAAVLAVATRLWTIAAELLGCALALRLARERGSSREGPDPLGPSPSRRRSS